MFEIKKDKKIKNNSRKDGKARNWLCTLNNPDGIDLASIHTITGAAYTVGQLEKGENGTPHLQFYQSFGTQIRLAHYKKILPAAHCEPAIGDKAREYCQKEDTRVEGPWEYGVRPLCRNSKTDWEEIFLKAKRGRIEEIPADIRVRCYSQLKKIEKDHLVVQDSDDLRGVWIYGESGIGKSRRARELYPEAYPKLCNKWWDGYQGQKYVIMDDLAPEHKVLSQQLKIWSDRYGCILETKGGALTSSYEKFIVTSQYSIEEIFGDDIKTVEALKRRFKVTHMTNYLFAKEDEKLKAAKEKKLLDENPFLLDSWVPDELGLKEDK